MDDIRIHSRLILPAAEVRESFARSTGPGGQNVNKVSTKVELRWSPAQSSALGEADREYLLRRLASRLTESGELIVTCDEHRTQRRNREEARGKLAGIIRNALIRPKQRRATTPTKASVKRRLESKRRRARLKKNRRGRPEEE